MKRQTLPGSSSTTRAHELATEFLPGSSAPRSGRLPGKAAGITFGRSAVLLATADGDRKVRLRTYRGLVVRSEAAGLGGIRFRLELTHPDPSLTVLLRVSADADSIAEEWQNWSRRLGLPMLLAQMDGSLTRVRDALGALCVEPLKPRRLHSHVAARRPRFLSRRKTGWDRNQAPVVGDEIIARR